MKNNRRIKRQTTRRWKEDEALLDPNGRMYSYLLLTERKRRSYSYERKQSENSETGDWIRFEWEYSADSVFIE